MLFFAAVFFLSSCGSSEPKAPETSEPEQKQVPADVDYDEMAEGFCKCMQPMYEFQKEVMKLMGEGKEEEVKAMKDEAMKIQSEGQACVEALEKKYGVVEGEENEAKATAALQKACPEIVALMNGEE